MQPQVMIQVTVTSFNHQSEKLGCIRFETTKSTVTEEIQKLAKYMNENNIGIAVRTGEHQYSGASSTSRRNIQLKLSGSFDSVAKDFRYNYSTNLLWIGRSFSVFELQSWELSELLSSYDRYRKISLYL